MAAMQDVAHPRHLGMQHNRQPGKLCKMSDVEAGWYARHTPQWRDGLAFCGNISYPGIAMERAQISEQVTSRPLASPFLRCFSPARAQLCWYVTITAFNDLLTVERRKVEKHV